MSDCALKQRIVDDMKAAMRARETERLGAIRLILAGIKQKEVDERIELTDADIIAILSKMIIQRQDSAAAYQTAGRSELAAQENFEISLIQTYLPTPLSDSEINELIKTAINKTGATTMKDMGALMNLLRPELQGRADMAQVSQKIKELLA